MPTVGTLINNYIGTGFTEDHTKAPYLEFTVESRYVWDEGLGHLPVAEPPQGGLPGNPGSSGTRVASEIVREHAPFGRKEVRFTATRMGAPPVAPHPQSYRNDPNEVFAHADVVVTAPCLQLLGTRRWSMRGVYTYYLLKPIWMEDGLRSGATPYDMTQEANNIYPPTSFSENLQ